jgi:hypothetical protein
VIRDRLAGGGQTDFFHAKTVEELIFIEKKDVFDS